MWALKYDLCTCTLCILSTYIWLYVDSIFLYICVFMCNVYLNVSYFSVYIYFNTLVIGNYYREICSVMSDYLWPHGLYSPWNSAGQSIEMGSLSLFQGIFPTQASNPGLPYCRWILYQLSHQRSPRILEWEAYPFSRGSSWPINQTEVSCIAGRSFTNWVIREDLQ